ncbi:MAG: hypothetical protein M3P32_03130 [Chloroflexota bacterium]|nr:hypothetical protein [Chloroflexota bacterium]
MTDAGFVIAAYGVILGGIGLYAALLLRRLSAARQALRGEADSAPSDAPR